LFVINDSDLKEWSKSYLGEKFLRQNRKMFGKMLAKLSIKRGKCVVLIEKQNES
jgi:hypothetical protein